MTATGTPLETRWLRMSLVGDTGKTAIYNVETKRGELLGQIRWYAPWRKYSFWPDRLTIYEQDCLRDIAEFIDQLMAQRKAVKSRATGGE